MQKLRNILKSLTGTSTHFALTISQSAGIDQLHWPDILRMLRLIRVLAVVSASPIDMIPWLSRAMLPDFDSKPRVCRDFTKHFSINQFIIIIILFLSCFPRQALSMFLNSVSGFIYYNVIIHNCGSVVSAVKGLQSLFSSQLFQCL